MFKNFLLTAVALLLFGATRLLFNALVIRYYGPAFVGRINQALSLFLFVPLFYAPGLGLIASKFASEFRGARQPDKSRQVFTFSFLVTAGLAALCTAIVLPLFPLLKGGIDVPERVLLELAPMLGLYSLHIFLRTAYYGFDRVSQYFRNELVCALAFVTVVAAALAGDLRDLTALAFAVQSTLFILVAVFDLRGFFRFRRLLNGIAGDLARYSHFFLCTIVNSLAGSGAREFGIYFTGVLTQNPVTVGYYSTLVRALEPLTLLPKAVAVVLVPSISRNYGAGELRPAIETTTEFFRPLFLFLLLAWGLGVIFGWEAIGAITAGSTLPILLAFELILLGVVAYLISMPPAALLNGTRHIGIVALGNLAAVALALLLWTAAVPRIGLIGAAAGYAALQSAKGLWTIFMARRIFGWPTGIGWSALAVAGAAAGLGVYSLSAQARARAHAGAALILLGLTIVLYAPLLGRYMERAMALMRSPSRNARF